MITTPEPLTICLYTDMKKWLHLFLKLIFVCFYYKIRLVKCYQREVILLGPKPLYFSFLTVVCLFGFYFYHCFRLLIVNVIFFPPKSGYVVLCSS